ncbi:MAG: hypothetical protein WAX89_03310 [Alphaproteobacteria bacterium]
MTTPLPNVWNTLLDTLDVLERNARDNTPAGVTKLENSIVVLGQVARSLQDAPPPDTTTTLRLHTMMNKLGTALPDERNVLREKITGLVKRAYAQQAYSKMSVK